MMKVAVIGAGNWGRNLVRNFHQLEALQAICDISPQRLAALSLSYHAIPTFHRIEELLDQRDLGAVAIATPAATHYRLAKQVLQAGKDVFVEKPMALRYDEGKELVDIAKRNARVLMVGHLLEYHPAIRKLQSLICRGDLGELCYIYSNRLNLGRIRKEENSLWSFAPHDIAVILGFVQQMPLTVTATGRAFIRPGIADVTLMTMKFQHGLIAHIFVSWLHPYKEQRVVVIGSRRMAAFNDLEPLEKLTLYEGQFGWNDSATPAAVTTCVRVEPAEPLHVECHHFIECLKTRHEPLTGGTHGLRVLQVLEAAQRSLESNGTPISIESAGAFT